MCFLWQWRFCVVSGYSFLGFDVLVHLIWWSLATCTNPSGPWNRSYRSDAKAVSLKLRLWCLWVFSVGTFGVRRSLGQRQQALRLATCHRFVRRQEALHTWRTVSQSIFPVEGRPAVYLRTPTEWNIVLIGLFTATYSSTVAHSAQLVCHWLDKFRFWWSFGQ